MILGPSVGLRRPMALIGDARQPTGKGKSGPVETGLTGRAAMQTCVGLHRETLSLSVRSSASDE